MLSVYLLLDQSKNERAFRPFKYTNEWLSLAPTRMTKDLNRMAWSVYDDTTLQLDVRDKMKKGVAQMRSCECIIYHERLSHIYQSSCAHMCARVGALHQDVTYARSCKRQLYQLSAWAWNFHTLSISWSRVSSYNSMYVTALLPVPFIYEPARLIARGRPWSKRTSLNEPIKLVS